MKIALFFFQAITKIETSLIFSSFLFKCNTERGCIDQLYIELGLKVSKPPKNMYNAFKHR